MKMIGLLLVAAAVQINAIESASSDLLNETCLKNRVMTQSAIDIQK